MNSEDFITYEQALALKKLGFKEKCFFFYENENRIRAFYVAAMDVLLNSNNIGGCVNRRKNIDDYTCDAPTLAQAQKWLRKEKKLSIEPVSGDTDEHGWEYGLVDRNLSPKFHFNCITYSSYEEALSAGITECIKILEKECQN